MCHKCQSLPWQTGRYTFLQIPPPGQQRPSRDRSHTRPAALLHSPEALPHCRPAHGSAPWLLLSVSGSSPSCFPLYRSLPAPGFADWPTYPEIAVLVQRLLPGHFHPVHSLSPPLDAPVPGRAGVLPDPPVLLYPAVP